ncbi:MULTISPECIES: ATP-binding protein [Streptomyces]|uniref:ATP-binding protein n=1 Tax=Streptomyces lycii TaxID=2654337 RepID=A0ABQ7FL94_9ACTN|nr:ATP-binding protein [Streptomyces lycii]KAF4407977.1 ATP-binding protein [Streptomyces lycii]
MDNATITATSPRPVMVRGSSAESIHRAREAARSFAEHVTRSAHAQVDAVVLVVSELVTNALRHGGGRYTLELSAEPDAVIASVSDRSPAAPRVRTPDLTHGSGGFGLNMIRRLGCELTITPGPAPGKTVHVQIPT